MKFADKRGEALAQFLLKHAQPGNWAWNRYQFEFGVFADYDPRDAGNQE